MLGPFGCGKTKALLECVKLLSLYDSNARILVCTHNNSAADIYVKAIHEEFMSNIIETNFYHLYMYMYVYVKLYIGFTCM